jgi:catechol 2,3-dioxygenase-like lactoylglutathione lyase family enzyme
MSKVPTDFRRVTMMVNEMDAALHIYRDILGMEVYYDNEIIVSGVGLPGKSFL